MTDHQSTHGPDCWGWGPKHYECAVREIERLKAERVDLEQFRAALVALSDYAYERHGDVDHPHCIEADRLLELIDGKVNKYKGE